MAAGRGRDPCALGVSIGIRVVVAIFAGRAGVGNVSNASLELALGITLLAENGVVALRGSRMRTPFASDDLLRRRTSRISSGDTR